MPIPLPQSTHNPAPNKWVCRYDTAVFVSRLLNNQVSKSAVIALTYYYWRPIVISCHHTIKLVFKSTHTQASAHSDEQGDICYVCVYFLSYKLHEGKSSKCQYGEFVPFQCSALFNRDFPHSGQTWHHFCHYNTLCQVKRTVAGNIFKIHMHHSWNNTVCADHVCHADQVTLLVSEEVEQEVIHVERCSVGRITLYRTCYLVTDYMEINPLYVCDADAL